MKRLSCTLALALLGAFATHAAEPSRKPFEAHLEPGQSHEECEHLEAGDVRRWHWKADAAADFNIHFHEADKVRFAVKRSAMRGDGGTFTAKSAQDYCWMWTAKAARVKVTGAID